MSAESLSPSNEVSRAEAGESHRAERPAGEEGGERRERRSRDRYGRDRRERGDRAPREGDAAMDAGAMASASTQADHAPASTHAPNSSSASATASPARAAMPRIGHYALPVSDLEGLAQASSLEWVQSNPTRVAEVQAAIAAEPKPVHVPRERPPLVVLDEGPLILVETRRDLQQLAMPFEATPSA
jgi:ribonuclease E